MEFYEALRAMAVSTYDHGMALSDDEHLADDWQLDAFRRLQHLRIYATPSAAQAASDAYGAAWRWGHYTRHGDGLSEGPYDGLGDPKRTAAFHSFYDRQEQYDEAEAALLEAIRSDLSVPD